MSEQDAINAIETECCDGCDKRGTACGECAYGMAKKALEDVRKYRALGVTSPEELEEELLLYKADQILLEEYTAICTVEEWRKLTERE